MNKANPDRIGQPSGSIRVFLAQCLNLFVQLLHPVIKCRYHACTFDQLSLDMLRRIALEFVIDLVLQARQKSIATVRI